MIESITQLVDAREARSRHAEEYFKKKLREIERSFDRECLAEFLSGLGAKMDDSRDKGRNGWWTCSPQQLRTMLEDHVKKGDPRDVAIIAMMLWAMGEPTHVA